VVAVWAAACDPRITITISSCAFSSFVGLNGKIQHHLCNAVPGVLGFGQFWDVAGLIAPRYFLAVHGKDDPLKARDEVDRAAGALKAIYTAAGVPDHTDQRYGDGGHRFYARLMWSFVEQARSG